MFHLARYLPGLMTTTGEESFEPGLEDLAAAAKGQRSAPSVAIFPAKTSRVPSRRILTAGGIILRGLGVLITLFGFWPFIWTVLEAIALFSGNVTSEARIRVTQESISLKLSGWPAIIFGLVWSTGLWCVAILAFAFGHALYVLRDFIPPKRDAR